MQITFLGSGAAFSANAYNASILVEGTLLLDAGAPLCVHLPKVGVGLDQPRATFITHFHADHCFNLAFLIAARHELFRESTPLAIYGPPGTQDWLRQLLDLAWGTRFREAAWDHVPLTVHELDSGQQVEVEGCRVRAYRMVHVKTFPCLGYLLQKDGVRLAYTGDTEPGPALEALVGDADHVIAEMTYENGPGPSHLSRVDIDTLLQRYPGLRFILTHRGGDRPVRGAVLARDFQTFHLPLT